jgi:protease-4
VAKCAAQHFGFWAIEPHWFMRAISAVNDGKWPVQVEAVSRSDSRDFYAIDPEGIAIVRIIGQITKGESSYGGTSSIRTRRAIELADRDSKVRGILLAIDSPGGTVAGTSELARAVALARKPMVAHIDDLGASAAYWVASQADRVTASQTTEVGSIGTMAVVEDFSGQAAMQGIKVYVISTGPRKGDFIPGTEIKPEQLERLQERGDDLNGFFLDAVADGRQMPRAVVEDWATGDVWIAEKAKKLGLIDQVTSFDQALGSIREETRPRRSARAKIAAAKIACAKAIFG